MGFFGYASANKLLKTVPDRRTKRLEILALEP
jgi:hypothetical protein